MWEKEQLLLLSVIKEGYRETLIASLQSSLVIPGLARGCLVAVLAIGLRLGGTVESDSNPGILS